MSKKNNLQDLLDSGTDCPIQAPRDSSAWNVILRQLGTMYTGTAMEALKEYITNSADAKAKNIVVELKRKGAKKQLTIRDDGNGMYLPESERSLKNKSPTDYAGTEKLEPDSILRLPRSIGDSAKKLDDSTQGNKAIGALAWQTICDRVTFFSRKEGEHTVAWVADHKAVGVDHHYQCRLIEESERPDIADRVLSPHGTTVTFEEVQKDVMKELHPLRIQKDLGSRFRDLLKDGEVSITVKDEDNVYVVKPEEYQGKVLIKETIETKYGPVAFEVYFTANKQGAVRVKQGIQTLLEDLGKRKNNLESDSWSSGYLSGQIRADFLTPTGSRQDMTNDDQSRVFFETVRGFNVRVKKVIDDYTKSNSPGVKREFYNRMSKAFGIMLHENPELKDLLNSYRASKRGEEVPGQPDETGYAPPPPRPPGNPSKKRKRKKKKGDTEIPKGEHSHPVDTGQPGTTTAKPSFSLRFAEEDLAPDMLSRFEPAQSLIIFNNMHQTYLAASTDPRSKATYLTALVGKELLGRIYREPDRLADEIIKFQQNFMNYFMQ